MRPHRAPALAFERGDDLQDVDLGGGLVDSGRKDTLELRPACFSSLLHEILFGIFAALALSSLALLQGATAILVSSIQNDLGLSMSFLPWAIAGLGYVYLMRWRHRLQTQTDIYVLY